MREPELQRYWWLKRFFATVAGLVVLLVVAWLLWSWYAKAKMAQLVAELKAAGQPVCVEDLNGPGIPESRNGVPLLQSAIPQISALDVPTASSTTFGEELPYPPGWHQMMDKAFPANAAVYPLVRQARLRGEADWQFQLTSPLMPMMAPSMNLAPLRHLANVLGDTALYHHFRGNDHEALETIADCLYLARATGERGFLVPALVATGIDAVAVYRVQILASDLQIPPGEPGEVVRADVRRMIRELADDGPVALWYARAFRDENVFAMDTSNTRTDLVVLTPLERLQTVAAIHSTKILNAAMREPTLPAAKGRLNSIANPEIPWISALDPELLRKLIIHNYRSLTYRRGAAVSLAVALYHSDRGHYPASLDELVPAYLAAIPTDPMSASGKPFSYLLSAQGKRPVLISAGGDGIVQTTDESYLPSSVCYGWQETKLNKCDDQYLDLSPWKDPTPPPPVMPDAPADGEPE